MKIKFDSNQEYQLDAINAVVDLFDGQPRAAGQFEFSLNHGMDGVFVSEAGFTNRLLLDETSLLANLRNVQERNLLPVDEVLSGGRQPILADGTHMADGSALADGGNTDVEFPQFSVEMETGTGKTYVYLRTIFELHKQYGFSKFIIVVPSVAIREGVLENIRLTREHFQGLYGNVPLDAWIYDSRQVSRLRGFATSNQLQVLIINIDAFNKDKNIINQENDRLSGLKPIQFIQGANPIVIMDEPQNMETETAKEAIASLKPLCTLRYSATHRQLYNQVYRLGPVRAYDLRLVKRIQVTGILDEPDFNQPFINVLAVETVSRKIKARVVIDVNTANGPKRKRITLTKNGEDLHKLSKERAGYQGYVVVEINAGQKFIEFGNGIRLYEGDFHGSHREDVMKIQVRKTVEAHFDTELEIRRVLPEGQRLKVLSLFFIDKVANYFEADGCIRNWFEEAYQEVAALPHYHGLDMPPVDEAHNGYFAKSKGVPKDTKGKSKADEEAYELIMKAKERLLSPAEPVRFIFSHSALREGWDNPNVFQICTLNESRSEMRKRQEIGRGMRLPVLETGQRCFDDNINKLTVIANEHYQEFAAKLQEEIESECGEDFGGRVMNARERRKAILKKGWSLNSDFKELWERIKQKTQYHVEYDSNKLIERAATALAESAEIVRPKISIITGEIEMSEDGLGATPLSVRSQDTTAEKVTIPDLLGYLQRETQLTRKTLVEILIGSGRLGEVATNPQQFIDQAIHAIRNTLNELIIDGIKYEKMGEAWDMLLFEQKELQGYLSRMLEVTNCIYDVIEFESDVERKFAQELDCRNDIKLFIKLPWWFKIDTPIGEYNPDWAIVKEEPEAKVYLVRETKSTHDLNELRPTERNKIRCGLAHFSELDVDFKVVTKADQV